MPQSHVFFNWRNLDRNEYRRGSLQLLLGLFLPAPMLLNLLPDEVRIDPILVRNSCHRSAGLKAGRYDTLFRGPVIVTVALAVHKPDAQLLIIWSHKSVSTPFSVDTQCLTSLKSRRCREKRAYHAPAKGATLRLVHAAASRGFDPRPREGGDPRSAAPTGITRSFRSTPPRRGRPRFDAEVKLGDVVSIHAPAKGATWASTPMV